MSRLKEHGLKVTYYDGLEYDDLVQLHKENGAAKLDKYEKLGEVLVSPGKVLRETRRINLVEGHGYCVVRFTIDKGASGSPHSHHNACNSNVLRNGVTESDFEIKDQKAIWLRAELRKAGNFNSRIPVAGKPKDADVNDSDTHAITNFSSEVTILEHLYPVSDGVVSLLKDIIKSVNQGIEKNQLNHLVADKVKYGEKATNILKGIIAEHKEERFSPQDFRTKLVEEILRLDTNKTYFASQEAWLGKAEAVYNESKQSTAESKALPVVQSVKGKWAGNYVVTTESKWESKIYTPENAKFLAVR